MKLSIAVLKDYIIERHLEMRVNVIQEKTLLSPPNKCGEFSDP